MREEQGKLSRLNRQALDVYDLLAKRIVLDFGLEPLVFDALNLSLTTDEARLLVEQLECIHRERCPVKRG